MTSSRKWKNVQADARVTFVDDLASVEPWRPRGIEVRGTAEAVGESGGLIRIHPRRVLAWGIETDSFSPTVVRDLRPLPGPTGSGPRRRARGDRSAIRKCS